MVCDWGDEDSLSELEIARQELLTTMEGEWKVKEVRKDNELLSGFTYFNITFTGQTYSTNNGAPLWPPSGNYSFANEETENEFLRADGQAFSVTQNAGDMQINLTYTEPSSRGVEGNYRFVVTP
jgi:hypothetical protein